MKNNEDAKLIWKYWTHFEIFQENKNNFGKIVDQSVEVIRREGGSDSPLVRHEKEYYESMAATMISKLPCQISYLPFYLIFRLENKSSQPITRESERDCFVFIYLFIYLFEREREMERERLKSILIIRR